MADVKISEMTALTAPEADDLIPIVDVSEGALANKNKKITVQNLRTKIVTSIILTDNSATSITPMNASGFLLVRLLAQNKGALLSYDALSPTAYISLIVGHADFATTTGTLAGTTGTDAKFTISTHTDGKIYFENRLGSTIYVGYIAL